MERLDESCPLDLLCDAIVDRYHASLHDTLPRIREDLTLLSSTGASHEVNMMRMAFGGLADQIEAHLSKEEHLLFPALNALAACERDSTPRPPSPFATVLHPIRMMEAEHARIEAGMRFLRDLAREVPEPVNMLPAWRHCMESLAELDEALREHHRTENEVLFPRALEIERRLP
jgi:regulator of cell morphogenesis and NO signaling